MNLLAAGASLFDIGMGIRNAGEAQRAEREARRRRDELLRLAQAQDAAEAQRYDRIYGRVQDEVSDYLSGTEGGAGRLNRIGSEQRMAAGTLRALEGDTARTETARRTAVDRSLAARGVTGGAAATALSELETDIAARRSEIAAGAVEGARSQRMQFALSAPQRVGGNELAALSQTATPFQAQADARGVGEGLEYLSLLWDESKKNRKKRYTDGGVVDDGGFS